MVLDGVFTLRGDIANVGGGKIAVSITVPEGEWQACQLATHIDFNREIKGN